MSYFADHLAWQQRLNQEFNARKHHQDSFSAALVSSKYSNYPDMVNFMNVRQKMQNDDISSRVPDNKKLTFREMRQAGKELPNGDNQPKYLNPSFKPTRRMHEIAQTSIGMQGAMNSGSYGYKPIDRRDSSSRMSQIKTAGKFDQLSKRSFSSHISQSQKKQGGFQSLDMDAVSFATRSSATGMSRHSRFNSACGDALSRRNVNSSKRQKGSLHPTPFKYKRFNEDLDTKSNVSRQERDAKKNSLMSTQNLAAFTKDRPTLKVIGTPNFNSTSIKAASIVSKSKQSVFSRRTRDCDDLKSYTTSIQSGMGRVRRSGADADQHKQKIIDAIDSLNDEELEKVSQMIKDQGLNEDGDQNVTQTEDENNQDADAINNDGNASDEGKDYVEDLESRPDDQATFISRKSSTMSAVSTLRKQLEEEQEARKQLEGELQQLQMVQSVIQKKIQEKVK